MTVTLKILGSNKKRMTNQLTTAETTAPTEMKINMVETNITTRWEKGIPHHPKSIQIFKAIEENDFKYGGDYFCFKSGGDGDNGEHLMYLLDIYFEAMKEDKS